MHYAFVPIFGPVEVGFEDDQQENPWQDFQGWYQIRNRRDTIVVDFPKHRNRHRKQKGYCRGKRKLRGEAKLSALELLDRRGQFLARRHEPCVENSHAASAALRGG